MRRSLAKFSESEASNHTPSLADFTTTTPELKFSVPGDEHKGGPRETPLFAFNAIQSASCIQETPLRSSSGRKIRTALSNPSRARLSASSRTHALQFRSLPIAQGADRCPRSSLPSSRHMGIETTSLGPIQIPPAPIDAFS